ncbi:hypothetical protein SBV47_00005 [Chlamydia crocodili]|uniref:hypothetical protein n=1 Tax=Chlamydia crocodili TaxID=2766982 RepID=UPI003D3DB7CE
MRSVPSRDFNLIDVVRVQHCCFNESRAHKVANIIVIVIGLLILAAGLVCSVLFGAELGTLYTMTTLGVSVCVGVLLLTIGASCLSCRTLVSKTRAMVTNRSTKYNSEISKIKQEISETATLIDLEEKKLLKLIEEYNKNKFEHARLLSDKNQASKELEIASKKCSEARTDLNSLLEKLQKDSSSSGGGGGGGG